MHARQLGLLRSHCALVSVTFNSDMTHVYLQRSKQGQHRTLVLRSTHSSQLRVGLLRFCFFLGGPSPGVREFDEASGLVEGLIISFFMMRTAHTRLSCGGWAGSAVSGRRYNDLAEAAWM